MNNRRPQLQSQRVHRPRAVRWANRVGNVLNSLGLARVSLSPESLKKTACRLTALTDFGDNDFEEGLGILTDSLGREADLSYVGRMAWSSYLVRRLKTRLLMQESIDRWPNLKNTRPERPMFVVGFPRTGTTLIYNLLACAPDTYSPKLWETFDPAPPPAMSSDAEVAERIKKCQKVINAALTLAPQSKRVHHFRSPTAKEECYPLLAPSFRNPQALAMAHVPSYSAWLFGLSGERMNPAYRNYAQGLAMLNAGHESERWLSKSPLHCWFMESLMHVCPDARVVHMQRDPTATIPSTCSLYETFRAAYSDNHRPTETGQLVVQLFKMYLQRFREFRQAGNDANVVDIDYQSLVQDPAGTVRQVHDRFGIPVSDEHEHRMTQWLSNDPYNPKTVGRHAYTAEEFGLDATLLRNLHV